MASMAQTAKDNFSELILFGFFAALTMAFCFFFFFNIVGKYTQHKFYHFNYF